MVFGWRVGSNPVFCLVRGICRDGMDVHLTPLATVKYGPHVSSSIVFFFFSSAPYLLPPTRCRRSTSSARRATATAGSRLCLRPAPPLVAPGGPHCPAGAPGLPPPRPFFFPTRACCPWLADLHAAGRHARLCAVLDGRSLRRTHQLAAPAPAPRSPVLLPLCSRWPGWPDTERRRRPSGSGWSARFGRTTPTRIWRAYSPLGLNPTFSTSNQTPTKMGPTHSNPLGPLNQTHP